MTTNTTSTVVSDLTQGTEYSFTVAGVDIEGRVGEESVSAQAITMDNEFKLWCVLMWESKKTENSSF